MELFVALAASAVFALAFRKPLKACPVAFYAVALLVAAAFASHVVLEAVPALGRALFPYIQRCLFAFGLLTIVMFVGALPEDSKLRRYLAPVRGELSIVASILVAGHVVNYAQSYLAQLSGGWTGLPATMLCSFAVSAILVALLVLLVVTSARAVRRRMDPAAWKRLQRLAYPFYLLAYVHLMLILAPAASSTEQKAFLSIVVYTVIIVLYALARLARAAAARRGRATGVAGTRAAETEAAT